MAVRGDCCLKADNTIQLQTVNRGNKISKRMLTQLECSQKIWATLFDRLEHLGRRNGLVGHVAQGCHLLSNTVPFPWKWKRKIPILPLWDNLFNAARLWWTLPQRNKWQWHRIRCSDVISISPYRWKLAKRSNISVTKRFVNFQRA